MEDLNASDEVSVGASHPVRSKYVVLSEYWLIADFSHQLLFKIRHLITKMCGQFGVRVPEVVAELLSLASSAQVEESPSEDEGQENDYDLSDQVSNMASVYSSGNSSRLFFHCRMMMMMTIMMNQDCLKKTVIG